MGEYAAGFAAEQKRAQKAANIGERGGGFHVQSEVGNVLFGDVKEI